MLNLKLIRRSYLISLFTMAILLSVGMLFIYFSLGKQDADSGMVNLAGRQRDLTQIVLKLNWKSLTLSPSSENDSLIAKKDLALKRLLNVQTSLQNGTNFENITITLTDSSRYFSESILPLIHELIKESNKLHIPSSIKSNNTINRIDSLGDQLYTLLDRQTSFYQWNADLHIQKTQKITLYTFVIILLILFSEGFFIFRPTIDNLDRSTHLMNSANNLLKEKNIQLNAVNDELQKKEDLLESQNIELIQLNEALENNAKLIKKSNEELEKFAYIISHDLKAPLRAIRNLSIWIEEDIADQNSQGIQKNFELLRSRVDRLEALINGVLAYSRATRNTSEVENRRIQTKKVFQDSLDALITAESKPVEIYWEGDFPDAFGNEIKFQQVVSNLLSNALKYCDKSPLVLHLRGERILGCPTFSVQDNGPGIPEEFHDKIFEIFQTLQARDQVESTGVGLAIVKKIIQENKGTIQVSSEIGQGSTFTFSWPNAHNSDEISKSQST